MKGLERLKDIKEELVNTTDFVAAHNETFRIKYCLNTREDSERYVDNMLGVKTIEKELKALEIIKNKMNEQNNSTFYFPTYVDLKGDFHLVFHKKEYDLLKEILA